MIDLTGKEGFAPTPEEAKFIIDAYTDFIYDRNLKNQNQDLLGGRTLLQFWTDSEMDYNVITQDTSANDPVVQYSSGISRDKANIFISNLAMQMLYPTVVAQNANQDIDRVMSRVSRAMLEWAHENDGRPFDSGHSKMVRYIHKMVVQGTVHMQDDIVGGKLMSTLVPNEEIFIPNFYQPNIQLQSRVMRVQDNITYQEAEAQFGSLDKFKKHVYPGMGTVFTTDSSNTVFNQMSQILNVQDRCQVVRIWRQVSDEKVREYKTRGILPAHVKRAKYFNILINGVLMFAPENLMPYHDGFYPITKGIFEMFSKPEYYWGNSIGNKLREDKKWVDGWKTLLRWKAKMAAIPPLITFNGSFVDSDIVIPGMITQAPAGMSKDDVQAIPGLGNGLTSSDLAIMKDGVEEIDRSTVSPQQGGQNNKGRQTAREILLVEANAKKILNSFALQVGFMVSARSFPILARLYQFIPKQSIYKIAVPNQSLPNGKSGTAEILFEQMPEMTDEEVQDAGFQLYSMEKQAEKSGSNKKIYRINVDYIKELDFYVKAEAEELVPDNPVIRQARADMKFERYANRPDLFNAKSAARLLVNENGDNEDEMLINDQESEQAKQEMMAQQNGQPMPGPGGGMGSGSNQNPVKKMGEQGNVRIADNSGSLPAF